MNFSFDEVRLLIHSIPYLLARTRYCILISLPTVLCLYRECDVWNSSKHVKCFRLSFQIIGTKLIRGFLTDSAQFMAQFYTPATHRRYLAKCSLDMWFLTTYIHEMVHKIHFIPQILTINSTIHKRLSTCFNWTNASFTKWQNHSLIKFCVFIEIKTTWIIVFNAKKAVLKIIYMENVCH